MLIGNVGNVVNNCLKLFVMVFGNVYSVLFNVKVG